MMKLDRNKLKINKYFKCFYVTLTVLFILGLIIRLFTLPSDKEIVIRNPVILRNRIISPLVEESIEKEWFERKILEKVDSVIEETLEESKETSMIIKTPVKTAMATGGDKALLLGLVDKYTQKYGVNKAFALCVLEDESQFHINPCGVIGHCDHGKAMGAWQFHSPTWQSFRAKMGLDTNPDLRADPEESTRTAMWAFSTGRASHWSSVIKGVCKN